MTISDVRSDAAGCLGAIGPSAKDAVPALLAVLSTNRSYPYLLFACYALGTVGPDARQSDSIAQTNCRVNGLAQVALIRIGADSLSPFIEQLKDTSNPVKWIYAANMVGGIPTNAESAIPLLIAGLNQTNPKMQETALGVWATSINEPTYVFRQRFRFSNQQIAP